MVDRMTTLVMIFCGVIFGGNLATGVVNLVHHHYFRGLVNCFVAGCVLGTGINLYVTVRRHRRALTALRRAEREYERQHPMPYGETMDAYELARQNLDQVMKVTGATWGTDGRVDIKIGKYIYKIEPGHIYRLELMRLGKGGEGVIWDGTCLQVSGFPGPEQIAAPLLLLKNDPTIFDRWKKHDAWYS